MPIWPPPTPAAEGQIWRNFRRNTSEIALFGLPRSIYLGRLLAIQVMLLNEGSRVIGDRWRSHYSAGM